MDKWRRIALFLLMAGITLNAVVLFAQLNQPFTVFSLMLMAWTLTPYFLCAATLALTKWPGVTIGGCITLIIGDLYTLYSVFIAPSNSTAAINLLFAPVTSLIIFLPLGLLLGLLTTLAAKHAR